MKLIATINGKDYAIPGEWSDITLQQAAECSKLFADMPPKLAEIYAAVNDRNTDEVIKLYAGATDEDMLKTFPEWFGRVMVTLTDIPDEVMRHTDSYARTAIYTEHIERYVYGLMFTPADFEPKNIEYFKHHGDVYYLPEDGLMMGGGKLPGKDITAGEFVYSADLTLAFRQLEKREYDKMATLISILCREKGKAYNDQEAIERAERFKDLPMSVVWEVYFFTLASLMRLSEHILRSSVARAGEAKKQPSRKPRSENGAGMASCSVWRRVLTWMRSKS